MPSTTSEAAHLLDRAVELLIDPTIDNLRAVEDLLRAAVAGMPERPDEEIRRRVRRCARLIESAEAGRPGSLAAAGVYTAQGARQAETRVTRLELEG